MSDPVEHDHVTEGDTTMSTRYRHPTAVPSADLGPWFVVEVPADFTSRSVHRRTVTTWVYLSGTYLVRPVTDLLGNDLAVTELDVIITTRNEPAYGWTWPFGRRTTHPGTPTVVTAVWPIDNLIHGAPAVLEDDAHTVAGTFRRVA
ncbi:hypothetical protein AB1046_15075 [Promicromonospora sp. Populi]|uniref:hypothetical protein n=1 Tax=Promicromonospora sp. Populi TaxID=3239420 RepID=UPI0034E21A7C